ncbi:helix-turn-helix domain-containing protein [Oceanobacillus neutriphilus]|nr:helix-turn-helix transcriptional regulator [Oceanobacillus neutriphilus]
MYAGRCLLGDYLGSRGWSQRYLARLSGVPTSTVSDYIRNDSLMSLNHAKNIANVLGCNIDDLYEWVSD